MSADRAWLARDAQVQFGGGLVVSGMDVKVYWYRCMDVGQDDGPPTASPRDHGEQHESTPTHAEYRLLLSLGTMAHGRVTHAALGACVPRPEARYWWRHWGA